MTKRITIDSDTLEEILWCLNNARDSIEEKNKRLSRRDIDKAMKLINDILAIKES